MCVAHGPQAGRVFPYSGPRRSSETHPRVPRCAQATVRGALSFGGVMTVTDTQATWLTQEAFDRLKSELDELITAARAEIDRASEFIATRHGGVRRRARTRLAEAERRYERQFAERVRPEGGTRARPAGRSPRGRGVHPRDDRLRALGRGAWRRLELRRGRRWLDPRRDHRRHPRRRRTGRRLGRIAVGLVTVDSSSRTVRRWWRRGWRRLGRRWPRAGGGFGGFGGGGGSSGGGSGGAVATPVAGAGDEPRNRPRIDRLVTGST